MSVGVKSATTSSRAVSPFVAHIRLMVPMRSPNHPQAYLPIAPPPNSRNSIALICPADIPLSAMTKGRNTSAEVRVAASSAPTPVSAMNPAMRERASGPSESLDEVSASAFALPMSTARRDSMEAIMNANPAIPTIMKVARQPMLTANSPATKGAIILPRSPAKFTVPTAVARPPLS